MPQKFLLNRVARRDVLSLLLQKLKNEKKYQRKLLNLVVVVVVIARNVKII